MSVCYFSKEDLPIKKNSPVLARRTLSRNLAPRDKEGLVLLF